MYNVYVLPHHSYLWLFVYKVHFTKLQTWEVGCVVKLYNRSLCTFDVSISTRDLHQKKFIHIYFSSCHVRVVTWQEIGCICGWVCSCPRLYLIVDPLSEYILLIWSILCFCPIPCSELQKLACWSRGCEMHGQSKLIFVPTNLMPVLVMPCNQLASFFSCW